MLFKEFSLQPGILKGLTEMKYESATDIQTHVIKLALAGKNIVGQSQTGTGKTAAFVIPLLQNIDTSKKWVQALILAPTRELVNQIGEEIAQIGKYYKVKFVCLYGGASPNVQKKNLLTGPSIIVATPGRLLDFLNQRVVNIWDVRTLILDEVDRMLDMGFIRDIEKIRALMPQIKQTHTFSATISPEIKKVIDAHVSSYEFIKIGEETTVDKIDHTHMHIPHQDKILNLLNLIKTHPNDKIVIFTQTKRNTKTLLQIIEKAWYKAGMLNGNMPQNKRNSTLKSFKENALKVLVTTDVSARGLNMENVGLVINFDVPKESESYIHRIGRTGRAGASGKAIMFVSDEEKVFLSAIEKMHKTKVEKSEHEPVVDLKDAYTAIRLDKSTDKFGKGRPNPNSGRMPQLNQGRSWRPGSAAWRNTTAPRRAARGR